MLIMGRWLIVGHQLVPAGFSRGDKIDVPKANDMETLKDVKEIWSGDEGGEQQTRPRSRKRKTEIAKEE